MALFRPTYTAKSAFDIPPSFYLSLGKKAVLFDLDNTLDPVNVAYPSSKVYELVERLLEAGLKVYVASNNTGKRVKAYCQKLGVESASGLLKPFPWRLKKWIKRNGYAPSELILVGDQLFTDVLASRGAKIDVVLTEPISEIDSVFTFLNRKIEKPIRKKIKRKGLCPEVRGNDE